MKSTGTLSICCLLVFMMGTSCQKAYERPDINLDSLLTGSPSTGGPGPGNGELLTKLTIVEGSTNVVYTYGYNTSKQLISVNMNSVVSGQTLQYSWVFTRDNAGKMLQYTMKNNIPGFPVNGVTYTARYPAGSANFDLLTAQYTFAGLATSDSIVFTILGGKVTKYAAYGNYDNSGYSLNNGSSYTYDNTGTNLTGVDNYEATSGTLKLVDSHVYEFDAKTNALQLGQEALIIGPETYFSKNNVTKAITTDYSTSATGVKSTTVYAIQYNAAGKPTSSVATDPALPGASAQLSYIY
jgi:hypothetical protein